MKIVVACGGTGGHSFPGIAVAKELRSRGHEVVVWSSGRDIEQSVLKSWDGPVFSTKARQLRPKYLFSIFASYLRCVQELRRFRPAVVLAMGSYASLPPVMAARHYHIPVVLHEANTIPGKAVEFLSRYAKVVAISFEITARHLPRAQTVLTGLPIRTEIARGERFQFIPAGSFTVFVTGGSQGAHAVNELASAALCMVDKELKSRGKEGRPLYVIHQTGVADEPEVIARYAAAGLPSRVHAFEREMANAFASADLVIARAGASTCFEVAACGKPTFFIPLPSSMRNHQHFNADAFVAHGAADEGQQAMLNARGLSRYILRMYEDGERLARMRERMLELSQPEADRKVADLVIANALVRP